jgi:uncharacterized protein YukE
MLHAAAQKAETTGETIAANLNALMTQIQTDGAALFKGGGGDAMQGKSAELNQDLRNILTALNTLAEATDSSRQDYGNTDADISNEINQVGGTFTGGTIASGLRG